MRSPLSAAAAGAVGLLLLSGCADAGSSTSDAHVTIAAAFYGVEYVAESIAGDRADIYELTPRGVSPHDLELSPDTVLKLGRADLVLYLSSFQTAVDDAVAESGVTALDVADVVQLRARTESGDEADHGDIDHGDIDPHFWQDPTLLAQYGEAVAHELSRIDPAGADVYAANAAAFTAKMSGLEDEYASGLAQCEFHTIVVTHLAYGYMTANLGITQVGLSDFDPQSEPSAARLLEIKKLIQETGVTTIFSESAVTSSVADSIARDSGATVAVLDTGGAVVVGDDYISLMHRNLDALRKALVCA